MGLSATASDYTARHVRILPSEHTGATPAKGFEELGDFAV